MVKRRKDSFSITPDMAARAVRRSNFWKAFEKLCERLGRRNDFFRLIRRRDADATIGEITEFRRKMTRLLAFNYDVHRCPDPCCNKKLFGTEPLRYPPEWRQA
ncbi:MAG: hypothetical protein IKS96_11300 [Fibrobacter sp.]|nr:hypothetical protein [Fibrobacter sp.]MBR6832858.1 hypothetical protein [Fibrobacter sp.]